MDSASDVRVALRTAGRALASGRLGQLVAARVFVQAAAPPRDAEDLLATVLDALQDWFAAPITGSDSGEDLAAGRCTAWLSFANGQSALVSVSCAEDARPRTELVLFGSHGTASWEPGADPLTWATADQPPAPPSDAARQVVADLRQRKESSSAPDEVPKAPVLPPAAAIRSGGEPPYGVLLVAGDHTHQPGYAEALAADPRCRLIGVTDQEDISAERLGWNQSLAHRLGIPYLPDLSGALTRDDVQIVSVCAEPYRRGDIIVQAADAGKHLYLDKPLCGSLADAERIVAAVRRAGVVAHMFSQVYWPAAQQARQWLTSGEAGDLQAIHVDLCFAKGRAGAATLGRPRRESAVPTRYELPDAKRELTNVGVYNVVLMLWLVNRPVRRVRAATGNYFFAEHQRHDMEDFGQVLLEFEGGLVATLTAGRTGWQSHPGGGLNRTYLVGSRSSAVIDTNRPRMEVWSDAPPWMPPDRDPDDPMGMWAAPPDSPFRAAPRPSWTGAPAGAWQDDTAPFLDCIQAGRQSEISAEVAAAATEILLAAYRSAAEQRSITLPLPR